jgi:hypothetical protein
MHTIFDCIVHKVQNITIMDRASYLQRRKKGPYIAIPLLTKHGCYRNFTLENLP